LCTFIAYSLFVLNCFFLDSAFTYRMLQVIHDEDGQAHIVDADSSIPVDLFSDIKRKSKMLVENH